MILAESMLIISIRVSERSEGYLPLQQNTCECFSHIAYNSYRSVVIWIIYTSLFVECGDKGGCSGIHTNLKTLVKETEDSL